jgi:hypothetical protein
MLVEKLKPGGVLKIFVPHENNIRKKFTQPQWKAAHDALHPLEHLNNYRLTPVGS